MKDERQFIPIRNLVHPLVVTMSSIKNVVTNKMTTTKFDVRGVTISTDLEVVTRHVII